MQEKIILFTFITNRTPIINVDFALTRVGLKIHDHHYILNWFQIWESHIKLKGLELASGSGKARMSILITSLLTTHIMDYLYNRVSMWNVPNVKGQ